ncbi:hypothetical protein J3E64_001786 [Sphingobium sp. OAS761]|nr:hypothetical protein [Sphingobium sp. OAS761]
MSFKAVAENAIMHVSFAFAAARVNRQKEWAFQASSPKTFQPPFGAAFFLFPAGGAKAGAP